jgi:hypothetical protein
MPANLVIKVPGTALTRFFGVYLIQNNQDRYSAGGGGGGGGEGGGGGGWGGGGGGGG